MQFAIILSFLIGLCFSYNLRPIVGILAYPTSSGETQYGKYYIAASYVKFIESAGGRVVPILYDSPESELLTLFNQINGILFPGGATDIGLNSPLYKTAQYLLNLAIQANKKGDYFPIEAHCLGFELLSTVVAQNSSILERFDSENLSLPLNFSVDYKESKLFGETDPAILTILSQQPVTMNNHAYGVTPLTYKTNTALSTFFRMISWDYDRNQKAFVSTSESLEYPFYLLQWHPEKIAFEWTPTEGINHSADSVEANEYMAEHFLSEVRKNYHKFSTPKAEYQALIYNYAPIYSASFDSSFTQIYFFPK
jgi:gamma-glutamyl hydrolase